MPCSMQKDPVVGKASELLRLGLMPSPAELKAGKVREPLVESFVTRVHLTITSQDLLSVDIQTVNAKGKVA